MHSPRQPHFDDVCLILRYLKGAPSQGLFYKQAANLSITGFSDVDWAINRSARRYTYDYMSRNRSDRWSTSVYSTSVPLLVVIFLPGVVKSRMVLPVLGAEAEYIDMAYTAFEMLWVRSLLHDLGIDVSTPMQMYYDNQASIFITNNPFFMRVRTKHIEVDCHFI
jgi:hypothetical protein